MAPWTLADVLVICGVKFTDRPTQYESPSRHLETIYLGRALIDFFFFFVLKKGCIGPTTDLFSLEHIFSCPV